MTQLGTDAFAGAIFPDVTERIIINLAADDAPLYNTLLRLGRKRTVTSPTLEWWSVDPDARRTQVNDVDDISAVDTTIVVDSTATMRAGDVICVERTQELLLVASVTNATTFEAVRSVGTTDAAIILDDDYLTNLGPFKPEGADAAGARNTTNAKQTSYTQIFERTAELTATVVATQLKTEAARVQEQRKKLIEVTRDIEHSFIFGEPFSEASSGKPRRGTMGVRSFAGVNVADANGTLTKPELLDWLSQIFAVGSKHRVVAGGRTAVNVVRTLLEPVAQGRPEDSIIGFKATRYQTADGEFDLVSHPQFGGETATELLAVDLQGGAEGVAPEICVLNGRDLALKLDVQAKKTDGIQDAWMGELGATWGNAQTHGRLTNVALAG